MLIFFFLLVDLRHIEFLSGVQHVVGILVFGAELHLKIGIRLFYIFNEEISGVLCLEKILKVVKDCKTSR